MATEQETRYAVAVAREHFGDVVAPVVQQLLRCGRQTLAELDARCSLPPSQVRNALIVLVGHGAVLAEDGPPALYACKVDRVLVRARHPRLVAAVRRAYGDAAADAMRVVLAHGRVTWPALKQALTLPRPTAANGTVRQGRGDVAAAGSGDMSAVPAAAAFRDLAFARLIRRVDPALPPRGEAEAEARPRQRLAGGVRGPGSAGLAAGAARKPGQSAARNGKQRADARTAAVASERVECDPSGQDALVALPAEVCAILRSERGVGNEIREARHPSGAEASASMLDARPHAAVPPSEGESAWSPDYGRLHVLLRNEAIVALSTERFGSTAAEVVHLLLRLGESRDDLRRPCSPAVPLELLAGAIPAGSPLAKRKGDLQQARAPSEGAAAGRGGAPPAEPPGARCLPFAAAQHLAVLCDGIHPVILASDDSPVRYSVRTSELCGLLRERAVESVVAGRYGRLACRIFRLVQAQRYVDQREISELTMIPQRETKERLYKMMSGGFVQLQPISRTPDHAASRSFFLWTTDVVAVAQHVVQLMYKASANAHCRRRSGPEFQAPLGAPRDDPDEDGDDRAAEEGEGGEIHKRLQADRPASHAQPRTVSYASAAPDGGDAATVAARAPIGAALQRQQAARGIDVALLRMDACIAVLRQFRMD